MTNVRIPVFVYTGVKSTPKVKKPRKNRLLKKGHKMSIQINQQLIMPRLKDWCETRRSRYEDNSIDLGRDVLDVAQGWFDLEPWKSGRLEHYDTKRECRIELKRHIMRQIDITDVRKSYFVPSFVWTWIAQQVITYIVKLIIDNYWEDIPT